MIHVQRSDWLPSARKTVSERNEKPFAEKLPIVVEHC